MCCLFGLMDYNHTLTSPQKSRILSVLAKECEARGTDAAGIAYNSEGKLHIYKRPVPAHKLNIHLPEDAYVIMGHTRMTTQGSEKHNWNNHPFHGKTDTQSFALAHNGVLYNDTTLRTELKLPKSKIQTDSYIAVQLIEQKKALNMDSLKYMAEQVEGSFCFTVLDDSNQIYFIKGDNPLCIYRWPKSGLVMYASTEAILKKALAKLKLPLEAPVEFFVSCGDILKFDHNGAYSTASFSTANLMHSWYVMNTRPTSWAALTTPPPRPFHERQYIKDLKALSKSFGYSGEDIDLLLEEGFSPEEIEDFFYCGRL